MAQHLDLEEQEQLDQLKHFWNRYGTLITGLLVAVLGVVAAWNGYQYWQHQRAVQASGLYDELERAAQVGDLAKVERSLADIQQRAGGALYAQQAALLAAKLYQDKGKTDLARTTLDTVVQKSADEGYRAIGRLRLAALAIDAKAYDEAWKILAGDYPPAFSGLVADRRGDVLLLQGKREQARNEYLSAYRQLEDRVEYRRLVEVKLNSLGLDPSNNASKATGGAS